MLVSASLESLSAVIVFVTNFPIRRSMVALSRSAVVTGWPGNRKLTARSS